MGIDMSDLVLEIPGTMDFAYLTLLTSHLGLHQTREPWLKLMQTETCADVSKSNMIDQRVSSKTNLKSDLQANVISLDSAVPKTWPG